MKYIETITVKCVVSLLASKTVYFLDEDKLDLFYRKHILLHITIFMHTYLHICLFILYNYSLVVVQLNLIVQHSAVKLDPATLRTHLVVALAFCSEGRRIWGSELSENSVT